MMKFVAGVVIGIYIDQTYKIPKVEDKVKEIITNFIKKE